MHEKLSKFDAVIARFDANAVAEEVDEACEMQVEMAEEAILAYKAAAEQIALYYEKYGE